jgi:hypothetical protein
MDKQHRVLKRLSLAIDKAIKTKIPTNQAKWVKVWERAYLSAKRKNALNHGVSGS